MRDSRPRVVSRIKTGIKMYTLCIFARLLGGNLSIIITLHCQIVIYSSVNQHMRSTHERLGPGLRCSHARSLLNRAHVQIDINAVRWLSANDGISVLDLWGGIMDCKVRLFRISARVVPTIFMRYSRDAWGWEAACHRADMTDFDSILTISRSIDARYNRRVHHVWSRNSSLYNNVV